MKNGILVVALLALIFAVPFINIWAINTLFGLGIAYTWQTWLASLIVTGLIRGDGLVKAAKNG